MGATGMRSLPRAARHERRDQAIRPRETGYTHQQIPQRFGMSKTGIFDICQRYAQGGSEALRDAPTGRQSGDHRLLTAAQETQKQRPIADKTPDQIKMSYALWTRAAVAELIEARFLIALQLRAIGKHLKRWGFVPKKPMKKTYEPSPAVVSQWLDRDYPATGARARAKNAEIHWGDENGPRSGDMRSRIISPKGQTPVVRINNMRHRRSVTSSVTSKWQMRWRIFDGALSTSIFIDFMKRLIRRAAKKGVHDRGQPARASRQPGESLAGRACQGH